MGNVYSQNAVAKYLENSSILKSAVKSCFQLLVFFSFSCHQTQTSADDVFINQSQAKLPLGQMSSPNDVIISQLQAISQFFSSYVPSGKFFLQQCCIVSEDHASYELLFCHELQSFVIFRVFFVLLGTSLLSFIDLFMDTCFLFSQL